MNAVEIEEAITLLADQPFDPEDFPFAFLEAFGNKATTIKRLKSGSSNSSDIEGGILQRNNIHMAVCAEGEVTKTLTTLKGSPATSKAKAKFILATDGKSRALMYIALDKLHNQGLKKAIITVPQKTIGSSFNDEPLSEFGFWADWNVTPKWNLCNAPGEDGGKVNSVKAFLESDGRVLVCTHATFRFAVDKFGVDVFDDCLIAIDEFHHVSANPDNKLGAHLTQFIARDKVHIVAMTGSYFRGDAIAVLSPQEEAGFESVILAKSMSEESLKQVAAVIAAKRINLTLDEARELAKRALRFKQERGRLPSITAADPWEKKMAEGVAFLQQKTAEAADG